eukprot:gb/GFBE01063778.1/.p1 GENE.gb/GFBE01063778.1/~~gb/GFBE01063778.1/.p1  ORF type:complete len:257 (+),score=14.48 gb/GFBE01063778.1/:1-771(+)
MPHDLLKTQRLQRVELIGSTLWRLLFRETAWDQLLHVIGSFLGQVHMPQTIPDVHIARQSDCASKSLRHIRRVLTLENNTQEKQHLYKFLHRKACMAMQVVFEQARLYIGALHPCRMHPQGLACRSVEACGRSQSDRHVPLPSTDCVSAVICQSQARLQSLLQLDCEDSSAGPPCYTVLEAYPAWQLDIDVRAVLHEGIQTLHLHDYVRRVLTEFWEAREEEFKARLSLQELLKLKQALRHALCNRGCEGGYCNLW